MARRKTAAAGASKGSAHPRARFTTEDVSVIFSLAAQGWSQREIAERITEILIERGAWTKTESPIRHTSIGKILRGETYAED